MSDSRNLRIKNARENNLKEISLEIPHDTLCVLTGVSGSGKSSLAFETVYAEGQRRYIETFSPYTRQFFDKVKRPNVDLIENVRPAIAIQQRTRVTNSRSTVGSLTGINDYLKIFWSNIAEPFCTKCGKQLHSWSALKLAEHLRKTWSNERFEMLLVCAPVVCLGTGAGLAKAVKREKERLILLGFSRYINPQTWEIESLEETSKPELNNQQELMVVLDRFSAKNLDNAKRLQESLNQAFITSAVQAGIRNFGTAQILVFRNSSNQGKHEEYRFYDVSACPSCAITVEKPRPALFSYNHPLGACPDCKGFGKLIAVDEKLCVPNPTLSIADKALSCWAGPGARAELRRLIQFCQAKSIPTTTPWSKLSEDQKQVIFTHKSREYVGVNHWFKRLERKIYKVHVRVFLSKYRNQFECPTCQGTRFRPTALAYQVLGKTLPQILEMPAENLLVWFKSSLRVLSGERKMPRQVVDLHAAITTRLSYLVDLGLPYLALNRQARTLSGGETQRVNLTTALGSELVSTHFVLDEPSVGLHARDTDRLIEAVKSLQRRGNSLLMVEHDPECIAAADRIIELGPGAGEQGGEIIFQGSRQDWPGITLSEIVSDSVLTAKPSRTRKAILKIKNARSRNLKGFDLSIPLNSFVCLTGVSGSGKSTLVTEVIRPAYVVHTQGQEPSGNENIMSGFENVSQLMWIDQSPLAKSPRANIATYTGIWDTLRDELAETEAARLRALNKSAFSFNVEGGRCPACSGAGYIREDMQFLSDVYIPCEVCLGSRFQQPVLEVRLAGRNVADLLSMSVCNFAREFSHLSSIARIAETLDQLGLGHLTLGNPLSELSGGEAQRLRLVPLIQSSLEQRHSIEPALLIFDEPTTGLHLKDVQRLVGIFKLLRDRGHSILCIEHNLALIAQADWIIDLGPEGGDAGGYLLCTGNPKELVESATNDSITVHYLRDFFEKLKNKPKSFRSHSSKDAQPVSSQASKTLSIEGAREHNLKDINVDIPLGCMVALTGPSGSGKSSIAKDIIYAEGQRRYLDCLSPYARQFINELKRPDIDKIKNVMPTICVYQHTFQPSRLSTVATMSEVYNFLRLLYAKLAVQHCPDHPKQSISSLSGPAIAKEIQKIEAQTLRILAPIIKKKKGHHRNVIERAVSSEIIEIRIDGTLLKTTSLLGLAGGLERSKVHSIDFVVAKIKPSNVKLDLIESAVQQALSLGGGTLIVEHDNLEQIYSLERACPICQRGFFKPDPEDLSFNSRRGMCQVCHGSGENSPGNICPECNGARLGPIGQNLYLAGRTISDLNKLTAPELSRFLNGLGFTGSANNIAEPILVELQAKLDTLDEMGLGDIALGRDCTSLSGGELQRLRLATAMGSPLTGAMYIFDEPSVGLHPLDNIKVLDRIRKLCNRGNSAIIIEHDPQSILAADWIIDIGPGGGRQGGEVVYAGPKSAFLEANNSITAKALRETSSRPKLENGNKHSESAKLSLIDVSKNNIKNLKAEIPLRKIVCVAGVSGAGKSSLVHQIIAQTIQNGKSKDDLNWQHGLNTVRSSIQIFNVVTVDQKPIGINSRSTPASYLGIWDDIRKLYASTIEAKSRGWKEGFFSYNTGKGRCQACKGLGVIRLEMSFLADAEALCETCQGTRYSDEASAIQYLGHNIGQVLKFTFEEACSIFANHRRIYQVLRQACDLGLGYLNLGQSSASLSGGESQRIKLVSELSKPKQKHSLYILDEPTTGLHKQDVVRLMGVLHELVNIGHSVILIEHDQEALQSSDWIIELGPGSGENGGRIVFAGPPQEILKCQTPWSKILGYPSNTQSEASYFQASK